MPSTLRLGSLLFTIIAFPVLGLAGEPSAAPAANTQVAVAAGFGFQDEEVSLIRGSTFRGHLRTRHQGRWPSFQPAPHADLRRRSRGGGRQSFGIYPSSLRCIERTFSLGRSSEPHRRRTSGGRDTPSRGACPPASCGHPDCFPAKGDRTAPFRPARCESSDRSVGVVPRIFYGSSGGADRAD